MTDPETTDDLELWWAEFFAPHVKAAIDLPDDFNRGQRLGFLLGRMVAIVDTRFNYHVTDTIIATARSPRHPWRVQ